ncbi:MAG TPA: adenine deaminase C-terminal domain-containing protein [Desulfosporosinus sp.]|nr:adenine deaminase C-terminal domain-containing protein [Desulfosporosinus sp.]
MSSFKQKMEEARGLVKIDLVLRKHSLGISETVDRFMTLAFLSLPVIPDLKVTDSFLS